LADTSRWIIDEVPEGYLRSNLIDVAEAEIAELFIAPDERGGTYLEVVDALAEVRLWRDPPLEIRGARAAIHLQEGMLNFTAENIELPNTRGEGTGVVDISGPRPLYDVVLTTPEFALADLRWL